MVATVLARRQRLLHDIAELEKNPYPNIYFIHHRDNIHHACIWFTPPDGKPLHLTLEIPDNWPELPPMINLQSSIIHPNIFGDYICASILKIPGVDGDYTPAYTLRAILIQMFSFFASDFLEQDYGNTALDLKTYRDYDKEHDPYRSSRFYCSKCKFDGNLTTDGLLDKILRPSIRNSSTSGSMEDQATTAMSDMTICSPYRQISDLPIELLHLICEELKPEDLTRFSRVWPERIGGPGGVVTRFNIVRNRELICFFLKKGFQEAKLGVGVTVDKPGRIGIFKSEFDILSLEAFENHTVRRAVHGNQPFECWLPLPISRRHFKSIRDSMEGRLLELANKANIPGRSTIGVIYAFMNEVVVRLSQQADKGFEGSTLVHASEKAMDSYYHLFHILLCLACAGPKRVENANAMITNFLAGKTSKDHVPNLGHLLIAILIADHDMTPRAMHTVIKEAITRNVVWMFDKDGKNMPELSYMESDETSEYRLRRSFEAGRTSYRLLMFCNLFRKTVNRGEGKARKSLKDLRDTLFDAHGAPPYGTATQLAQGVRDLQDVNNFSSFLKNMGLTPPTSANFTDFLRRCVQDSMTKGYSVWAYSQAEVFRMRVILEPNVGRRPEKDVKKEWDAKIGANGRFFPNKGGGGQQSGRDNRPGASRGASNSN